MAPTKHWRVQIQGHPGSTAQEIADEPDWGTGHQHRVGYKNRANRLPGITHEHDEYRDDIAQFQAEREELRREVKAGKLVNFREVIQHQEVCQH